MAHFIEGHSYRNSFPGVEVERTELCLGGQSHHVANGETEVVDRAVWSGAGGLSVEACDDEEVPPSPASDLGKDKVRSIRRDTEDYVALAKLCCYAFVCCRVVKNSVDVLCCFVCRGCLLCAYFVERRQHCGIGAVGLEQ